MNLSELTALLANGESDRVEFKTSTAQLREATKTVCALLNGLGGFVFFGVTPDGKAVGQQVSTRTLEELTNELRRIEPPAFPDIETIVLDRGRSVIALRIPGGGGPTATTGALTCATVRPHGSCPVTDTSGSYWKGCTPSTAGRTGRRME